MVRKALEQLGFNEKEVNVYLACLKLGPSSVRKIAAESGVNRGTTYDVLKKMVQDGLISYYHQDKHQYFIAEDPEKLTDMVEEKHQKLLETKGRIHAVIPQLKSMFDNAQQKPVVKFYEGHSGAKTILQEVLDTCARHEIKEYYVYSSSEIRTVIYKLYPNFSHDRIRQGIKVRAISVGPGGEKRGLDERKWLTEEISAPAYTIVYEGHVAMITLDTDEKPLGVIIKDRNIYSAQKMIFEFIWEKL